MYYIYQFLNEEQIPIYIGITNDIKRRISQEHFTSRGHLTNNCYIETKTIIYSECYNRDDAIIKEHYLINKLKPRYNKQCNNENNFNFEINDFKWLYIPFNKEKFLIKNDKLNSKSLKNQLKNLNNTIFTEFKIVKKYEMEILYFKNKNTEFYTALKIDKLKLSIVKINGKLFFGYNQIANIFNPSAFPNTHEPYLLLKSGTFNNDDIIIFEDEFYIKNNVTSRSYQLNTRSVVYPKATQLISVDGVYKYIKYNENLILKSKKHSYRYNNSIIEKFIKWFNKNYDCLKNINQ